MRIPFPERVPLDVVVVFAAVLFAIQMVERTALYFSLGCVAFILIAALAFNIAGGLTRASGGYVFFYSTLVVILGLCYKAFVGEPADSNLTDPRTDIEVYVGGITAMLGAVVISRRFIRRSGLLQNILKESQMRRASVGCMVFGAAGFFAIGLFGESGTKLMTAFAQLDQLIPLGILIGVMYEIRHSGGSRSANLYIILGGAYSFFLGMVGFSKQGMLTALFCWLLPVCALRYRLSAWQLLSFFLALFITFHYLVPFSQYGRGLVPEGATQSDRIAIAIPLLEHPEETRRVYYEVENQFIGQQLSSYYDKPGGFWERLQMISPDDRLNSATDQGKVYGLSPIAIELMNAIPHVFWKDKPAANFGNMYAHDITGEAQGEGDTTTGISFSPTAEAYHLARWDGIFIVAPLIWCIFFIVFDTLFGDLRTTPWGLLALAIIAFWAPEGGITGVIHLLTFGVETLVFCAFFATWFAPIISIALLGPEGRAHAVRQLNP